MKSCGILHNKPLDPPHWTLTSCFVVFPFIWVHLGQFVALRHSIQNGPNWCKSSFHEVASEFITANAPDPPHWTLNSCFCVFRTIWMYLEPFGCLQNSVQNGPKWCKSSCHEVVSEFFATNAPDPPYWPFPLVSVCFVLFGCIWDSLLHYNTQFKTGQTWCKSSCHEVASKFFATNAPDPPHWTQN